jgi:hypothetical protein
MDDSTEAAAALLFFFPEFLSALFGDFTVPWRFPRRGVDADPLLLFLPDRLEFTLTEGNDRTDVDPQDWSSDMGVVSIVDPDIIRLRVRFSFGLIVLFGIGTGLFVACSTGSLALMLVAIGGDGAERVGTLGGLFIEFSKDVGAFDANPSLCTSEGGCDGKGERGLATVEAFSTSSSICDWGRGEGFILFVDRCWFWCW